MTRLVEFFFSFSQKKVSAAKINPRCCVSICYSVSFQMLPFLEPSSPSKHHSWVDGRLSAASDLLTLALQQIHSKKKSQASDRHCRSVRWRTWGCARQWPPPAFVCTLCYYCMSLLTAAVFCLYAVKESADVCQGFISFSNLHCVCVCHHIQMKVATS